MVVPAFNASTGEAYGVDPCESEANIGYME